MGQTLARLSATSLSNLLLGLSLPTTGTLRDVTRAIHALYSRADEDSDAVAFATIDADVATYSVSVLTARPCR